MKTKMKSYLFTLAVVLTGALNAKAQLPEASTEEIETNSKYFRTWVKTEQGRPTAVGFTAAAAVLNKLPNRLSHLEMKIPHAKNQPFQHLYVVWEPGGHEPPGIYDVPHFDVHFYLISEEEREEITCTGADEATCMRPPVADARPQSYAPTPAGVPKMGWHWIDLLAPELNGGDFTSTMIYGFYDGGLIFLEPMITKSFLMTKPKAKYPIRQPKIYPSSGYFPMSYSVSYEPISDQYNVVLEQMVYRKGSH